MSVETWQPGMFERPCAGCTMCCKMPAIPEIGKPANFWCKHCDKGVGCRIYAARPQACQAFQCLWKVMPDFPEELRPDLCKVIWTMPDGGTTAVATTEYPQALAAKTQERLMRQFVAAGISVQVRVRSARD